MTKNTEFPILAIQYRDGSKRYTYSGAEFVTNPAGAILWRDNWSVVDTLVSDGFAKRTFYRHLYGHVEYTLQS